MTDRPISNVLVGDRPRSQAQASEAGSSFTSQNSQADSTEEKRSGIDEVKKSILESFNRLQADA